MEVELPMAQVFGFALDFWFVYKIYVGVIILIWVAGAIYIWYDTGRVK